MYTVHTTYTSQDCIRSVLFNSQCPYTQWLMRIEADDSTGCMNTSRLHMLVQIPCLFWESKTISRVLHNTNKSSSCTSCLYSLLQEQSTGRCWQCSQPIQYVQYLHSHQPPPTYVNRKLHTPKPPSPIHIDLPTHKPNHPALTSPHTHTLPGSHRQSTCASRHIPPSPSQPPIHIQQKQF